jgi:hypothetical protein
MPIMGSSILTKLNLQPVLARLGVEGIATHTWDPVVHPVALVDGSVQAVTLQALDVPFTAGELVNPAANTRLASTGALVAGQFNLTIIIAAGESNRFRLRRRNAADAADIWSQLLTNAGGSATSPGSTLIIPLRVIVSAGELIVVENVGAGAATYQASIWAQGPF